MNHTLDWPEGDITLVLPDDTPEDIVRMRAGAVQKEIEMGEWLQTFAKGDVLYDIGANVGSYALLAAWMGHPVIAFEPVAATYAALVASCAANRFGSLVTPIPLALGNRQGLGLLTLSSLHAGAAEHGFAQSLSVPIDADTYHQPCLVERGDHFVRAMNVSPPAHLKVDVDGAEVNVLKGFAGVLPFVKSILVEVTPKTQPEVEVYLTSRGLFLDEVHPHKSGVVNLIFRRDG